MNTQETRTCKSRHRGLSNASACQPSGLSCPRHHPFLPQAMPPNLRVPGASPALPGTWKAGQPTALRSFGVRSLASSPEPLTPPTERPQARAERQKKKTLIQWGDFIKKFQEAGCHLRITTALLARSWGPGQGQLRLQLPGH